MFATMLTLMYVDLRKDMYLTGCFDQQSHPEKSVDLRSQLLEVW